MKLVLANVGKLFTGDIRDPLQEGPLSITIEDGKIKAVEKGAGGKGDKTIDVNGMTVCPGLIDSHTHPVFGDFTPRQSQVRLHREQPARRRHVDDLGRRGASTRQAEGQVGDKGIGPARPQIVTRR